MKDRLNNVGHLTSSIIIVLEASEKEQRLGTLILGSPRNRPRSVVRFQGDSGVFGPGISGPAVGQGIREDSGRGWVRAGQDAPEEVPLGVPDVRGRLADVDDDVALGEGPVDARGVAPARRGERPVRGWPIAGCNGDNEEQNDD